MSKNDKKQEETKAVTKSDQAGLPAEVPQGYWGEPEKTSSKEMLIPKFLMCQGQSKLVLDNIRKAGDVANSVSAISNVLPTTTFNNVEDGVLCDSVGQAKSGESFAVGVPPEA